jgi:hypothetical protein
MLQGSTREVFVAFLGKESAIFVNPQHGRVNFSPARR